MVGQGCREQGSCYWGEDIEKVLDRRRKKGIGLGDEVLRVPVRDLSVLLVEAFSRISTSSKERIKENEEKDVAQREKESERIAR